MRALPVLLLIAIAGGCGRGERVSSSAPSASPSGPDPIVLRISRGGGSLRAYKYPSFDSSLATTPSVPSVQRVLAFDAENGILAFIDTSGAPGWFDLRLGAVRRGAKNTFISIASADGWSIYGITNKKTLARLTPTGEWELPLSGDLQWVVPTSDGTVLILLNEGESTRILRLRPPDDVVTDSTLVPRANRVATTLVGDRVYFGTGDRVLSVHSDRIEEQNSFDVGDDALALAPTPSGDRVFVSSKASRRLRIINRYAEQVTRAAELPGFATELRMDPLGRWLLARPESGDSAWVVSVADGAYIGTVPTRWRPDLPTVGFDGNVVTLRAGDVVLIDPVSGNDTRVIEGGAGDTWHFVRWNGFRPRAKGIDQPVSFNVATAEPEPVIQPLPVTTAPATAAAADIDTMPTVVRPSDPEPTQRLGWIVSFATVLSAERAEAVSSSVSVAGRKPRIVRSELSGTTVFRVLMGPYRTRDEAERIGRESRQTFWVYQEVP